MLRRALRADLQRLYKLVLPVHHRLQVLPPIAAVVHQHLRLLLLRSLLSIGLVRRAGWLVNNDAGLAGRDLVFDAGLRLLEESGRSSRSDDCRDADVGLGLVWISVPLLLLHLT